MLRLTITALFMILFSSTGVATARDLPPDMMRIFDRGTLRVGMYYADIAPFFMHSADQKLIGVDVDLARDIATKLGVELKLVRTAETFDALIDMLEKQEVDIVISLLSRTLHRAQTVRFTSPYIVLRQGLLINRVAAARADSSTGYDWIFKSTGPVGVKIGTAYLDYAQANFPNAEIRSYPEWENVVDACIRGEVLFAYHDEIEVKKIIRDNPAIAIQLQTAIISDMTDPIAIAVPWNSTQLLAWLEMYIEKHPLRMDTDTLLEKYYAL